MLEPLFSKRSDWHLVFIGPVQRESLIQRLRSLPNVHFLGRRPHENLPGLLTRFDVGLIPIVINGFTRALSPLKLFEYMGAGVPIVSTDFEELRQFRSLIKLTPNDACAFERAIEETLAEDRGILSRRLHAEARNHTWGAVNRDRVVPVLRDVFGF